MVLISRYLSIIHLICAALLLSVPYLSSSMMLRSRSSTFTDIWFSFFAILTPPLFILILIEFNVIVKRFLTLKEFFGIFILGKRMSKNSF